MAGFRALVVSERKSLADQRDAETDAFDGATDEENHAFEKHTTWQLELFDEWVASQMAEVDAAIADLSANYISTFMDTLFKLQVQAQSYQRVLLTAEANSKRADFFNDVAGLRQELADCFADVRSTFVSQVSDEWTAVMNAQSDARDGMMAAFADLTSQWTTARDGFVGELADASAAALEWLTEREILTAHILTQFDSGFNGYTYHYAFIGRDDGGRKQIYGYDGHDWNTVNVLDDRVSVFNDDIMGEFVDFTDTVVSEGQATKDMIIFTATAELDAATTDLCNTLDALIARIILERETREIALSATLEASMDDQTAERERIEGELSDLKTAILDELQRLKDWLFGYHGTSVIATGKLWDRIRELTEVWNDANTAAEYEFSNM
jgi:hypothetical protein